MAEQYIRMHRNRLLTINAESIDDFIEIFERELQKFKEWKRAGVVLDRHSPIADDCATFTTDDPVVAVALDFVLPPFF